KDAAMKSDARMGTHPIIQPISDVLQASQAFDEITYSKGAAVIRMLEDYLGEEPFRDGVRAYMRKHAYGNTVTDDLWAELDKSSGKPVSLVAHDFTLLPGVPLIRVAETSNGIQLSPSRFAVDESGKQALTWHIPVTVAKADGSVLWRGLVSEKPEAIETAAGQAVIVNAGQAGYYRTLYAPGLFATIANGFASLSAYDQMGLLSDYAALGSAGVVPATDVLELVGRAKSDMDPKVLGNVVGQVSRVVSLLKDTPDAVRAKAYGRNVLTPMLATLGWDAKHGEDNNIGVLRSQILVTLGGDIADPSIIAEARKRFVTFLADHNSLSADLRGVVFGIVARHATAADWDALHKLARETDNSMEKREYYVYLGIADDKALIHKALDLTLTDEMPVTIRPAMVSVVAGDNSEQAFDFATTHMGDFDKLLEPSSRNQFYVRLAMGSHEPEMIRKLEVFGAAHVPETARAILVKAKAMITQSIKVRNDVIPTYRVWLNKSCKTDMCN
ncbi:MAG: M1 family metallopeptidase, partial [Rhizomicrobium sp.]